MLSRYYIFTIMLGLRLRSRLGLELEKAYFHPGNEPCFLSTRKISQISQTRALKRESFGPNNLN